MRLYVGNVPFSTTDEELHALFEPYGEIVSANVIRDRETDRSRGFAFVEFESTEAAQKAITALDGSDMGGRILKVNEARERRDRGDRPPRRY